MYSPKIDEKYIPVLYRLKLAEKTTMTKLVNEAVHYYLLTKNVNNIPADFTSLVIPKRTKVNIYANNQI